MNESNNFHYMWNEWIIPVIDDLYSQMDVDFCQKCGVKKRDLEKLYQESENFYQSKREEVKRLFYGEYHKGDSITKHRMDFHKIGAIICKTLVQYKVFDFDLQICNDIVQNHIDKNDTDWVVRNALINYRVAFYASIVVLFHSMRYSASKNGETKLFDNLEKNESLNLYVSDAVKGREARESFENCMVLDLSKRDIHKRSFDYFMYAIVLYQLEEYNQMIYG